MQKVLINTTQKFKCYQKSTPKVNEIWPNSKILRTNAEPQPNFGSSSSPRNDCKFYCLLSTKPLSPTATSADKYIRWTYCVN